MRQISFMFVLLFAPIGPAEAFAYDCAEASASESFRRADFVFEGEVVGINYEGSGTTYTFRVDKSLKGDVSGQIVITAEGTSCDAQFSPNEHYRVYARKSGGKIVSGQCAGNRVLNKKRNS
jgi:hypothetical protein